MDLPRLHPRLDHLKLVLLTHPPQQGPLRKATLRHQVLHLLLQVLNRSLLHQLPVLLLAQFLLQPLLRLPRLC
jgi:hypothetical protein